MMNGTSNWKIVLYLAAILDLGSRRVVGWSLSDNLGTQLPSKPCAWLWGTGKLRSFITPTGAASMRARPTERSLPGMASNAV